MVFVDYIGI